jgi:uncharacterized membrane protein
MKFLPKVNWIILISACMGLVDSLYLTWIKISNTQAACLPGIGNCEVVNTSRYSQIFGIPVAAVGSVAYILMIAILALENKKFIDQSNTSMALFGIGLVSLLFSAYLTYLELFVIHAICPFCVLSAVLVLVIFISSLIRLANAQAT